MTKLQVTSKGCSRGFILAALFRCLEYVRSEHEKGHKIQPPFPDNEISLWLEQAMSDCVDEEFQKGLGGTNFDAQDECTYWTHPKQFATWVSLVFVFLFKFCDCTCPCFYVYAVIHDRS